MEGIDDEKLFNFAIGFLDPQDSRVDYTAITPEIGKLEVYYRRRTEEFSSDSNALFKYDHETIQSHRCTEEEIDSKFFKSSL